MTTECSGISADRKISIPLTRELSLEINRQRAAFKLVHAGEFSGRFNAGKYTDGPRFRSNEDVIRRIDSQCASLLHFETFQTEWIQQALRDCAEADYWYTWEKDYGVDR